MAYLLNMAYLTLTRYATQFLYLKELAANTAPHLEISWTTRFNARVPKVTLTLLLTRARARARARTRARAQTPTPTRA